MNYYISDLHLGHANVIRFDNRPFKDLTEMHDTILRNWNERVRGEDTVYILGDFCWAKESEWPFWLGPLAGQKVLIRGNHDPREFSKATRRFLQDVKDYKEIHDGSRRVILCHYPIPFYKRDYDKDTYMLCGHVHVTGENDLLQRLVRECREDPACVSRGQLYNVGCMMPYMNYTPRTLDEIIHAVTAREC